MGGGFPFFFFLEMNKKREKKPANSLVIPPQGGSVALITQTCPLTPEERPHNDTCTAFIYKVLLCKICSIHSTQHVKYF